MKPINGNILEYSSRLLFGASVFICVEFCISGAIIKKTLSARCWCLMVCLSLFFTVLLEYVPGKKSVAS